MGANKPTRMQPDGPKADDFRVSRYRLLRSFLPEAPAQLTALDLGAGDQPITAGTAFRLCITADIRPDRRPRLVCNLADNIPLASCSVNVVVAGELIEHIAHARRFLGEIYRVLAPGGWLVLSTPNIVSLKYRLAFLLGRIPAHAARADYTYAAGNPANAWGHVRDYSQGELRYVLEDNGFQVVAMRGNGLHWHGWPVAPDWLLGPALSDNLIVKAQVVKS